MGACNIGILLLVGGVGLYVVGHHGVVNVTGPGGRGDAQIWRLRGHHNGLQPGRLHGRLTHPHPGHALLLLDGRSSSRFTNRSIFCSIKTLKFVRRIGIFLFKIFSSFLKYSQITKW